MNSQDKIRKIIILGGGTAGWLAACHLARKLKPNHSDGIQIELIESPHCPNIGVGEGTVPLMAKTLKEFGISESEFIQSCNVSFKQGILFENWNKPAAENTEPHRYYHPFEYPLLNNDSVANWLQTKPSDFSYAMGMQSTICDLGLAPKAITDKEYEGKLPYGYHLDAGLFSQFLAKHATTKLGVSHRCAHIIDAELTPDEHITCLIDEHGNRYAADFFVDCSGFEAFLLQQKLQVPTIPLTHTLFVDRALTIQIGHDERTPIVSYTKATAHQSGWIWDIALPTRRGIGLVYSSQYMAENDARTLLGDYINDAEKAQGARLIDMKIGYKAQFWKGNCVAIGLAQGFVEPLEATGLLLFDVTSKLLATQFPVYKSQLTICERRYNQDVKHLWESVAVFIKLHYALSNRDDSRFWLDNRDPATWPPRLNELLHQWRYQVPSYYDLPNGLDAFHLENYLYVLYGMAFETRIEEIAHRYEHAEKAQQQFATIRATAPQLAKHLQANQMLLEKIKQFGLSKI
ncbi:tryptophan halogenase family protein [Pseudoalteromonas fenneropenaei]|uniref:Tryptophan halogenase family protein n=1 Tax=Pseudoalteromonas fenneropenaei TaxID=1737459 RepID=A0ABV7CM56_9GAMM